MPVKKNIGSNGAWTDEDLPVIDDLSQPIANIESKGGDYGAVNPSTGAMGKYQFVPSYHWKNIQKVTGVKTKNEFLDSPEAQEKFFEWHAKNNLEPSMQRIRGYNKDGYNEDQLKMLVHFKGEGGAKKWLQNHIDDTSDNNIPIDQYIGKPQHVQTQSTSWSDEDLPIINDDSQKKSPDVSDSTLATSSQAGPDASSTSNNPQAQQPPAPQMSQQEVVNSIFGKDINNQPVVNTNPPLPAETPTSTASDKTKSAVETLANDYLENQHLHPQEMQTAFQGTAIDHPENPLNKVTDPNADPVYTGQYFANRKTQLERERNEAINSIPSNPQAPQLKQAAIVDITNQYNKKISDLENASKHLTSLQIFKKEYENKPLTEAETGTKLDALTKQKDTDIKAANKQLDEDLQGKDKLDFNKVDEDRRTRIADINKNYQAKVNEVKSKSKWDGVRLGIEQKKLLGDKQAEEDAIAYDAGKAISPARRYQYQLAGNEIKKTGVDASNHEEMIVDAGKHIESDKKIEKDNIDYLKGEWANKIGNAKYNNENLLQKAIGTIIPSSGLNAEEDIKKYGKQAGLTESQIKQVDPGQVPTPATLWQQFAKGALNTAAPLYEQGIRAAVALTGGDNEAVNEHFQPGWENQRGLGAAVVGNMPSDQNSFHNIRGALGQMFEGAGGLSTFTGEVSGVSKAAELTGIAGNAASAEKMANFGVMAFNGYNSAYHDANEVIGDDPKDEWKRQGYAILNGLIEGKIFSISPKSELVKNALGLEGKSGEQILNEIKKAKGMEIFQDPSFKEKIGKYITEITKENGKQVTLAVANKLSNDIINTIVNPEREQNIPEDLKNTTISTAIAMAIPSIMGGIGHVSNETPLNKAALFELGTNPTKYTDFISQQLSDGKITPEAAQTMHDGILTMKSIISHTPTVNLEGQTLSPDQVKDYSYNLFQEHLLDKKADALKKGAELAGIKPDKAQMAPLNKRIADLEKQRIETLKDAGTPRPPTPYNPPKEEENSIPEDERSVATEAKSAEETPAPKKEAEKLVNTEEKNIPLSSTEITEPKTTENEQTRSEDQNRGQSSAKTINNGQESANAKETTGAGRNEQPENRKLKAEKQNTESKATPTEQPLPVTRKRRKLVEEPEEEPIKSTENASTQSKEQQQESAQQSSEPEHARVESAGSEEKAAQSTNSDSHIGGEAEKEVIPQAKPNSKQEPARSVAPPAKSENKTPAPKKEQPKRNQHKKGFSLTHLLNRKEKVSKEEPHTLEEYILHSMLGMNDKKPEKKWSFKSVEKHIAKGAEEKAIAKQFASDHPKDTPIDTWAADLIRQSGEAGSDTHFHVQDEQEVTNAILENISKFPTKTALLEHLEDLQRKRQEKEHKAEADKYEKRIAGHDDDGKPVYEYVRKDSEPTDHDLAQMYAGKKGEDSEGYNDEGHPIHKQLTEESEKIDNTDISPEDEQKIKDFYAQYYDENTGKVDYDKAHTDYAGLDKLKEDLSKPARVIVDDIVPFYSFEQHSDKIQKLITDANKHEQQKRESAAQISEGKPERESTAERSIPAQAAESSTSKETGGKTVKSFETSQGSKYEATPDGKFKRTKTATGEEFEPQDHTVFVKFKDDDQKRRFLEGVQDKESDAKVSLIGKGEDKKVVLTDKKTGKVLEEAETTTTPTEGYNTYDQRRFTENGNEMRESHIGNEVTKINYAEPTPVASKPLSIDEKIKLERTVHQKLIDQGKEAEKERQKAMKSKDPEAIQAATDKVNDLKDKALAKEDKIEKLINQQTNESIFRSAADWVEKTYAKNKKAHAGESYASLTGLSPNIADHVVDYLVARVVEGLHSLGNREVAIRRAIRLTKEKYGDEAKDLSDKDIENIKKSEQVAHPKLKAEPVLPIDHEEYAKDILADILSGKITHDEAKKEVWDEIIENREGKPSTDHVQENIKAKILNYIDWHIQQDTTSIKNATTRLRRAQFGLNEEIAAAHKEFGKTWDEAKGKIEDNPQAPLNLIAELSQKARPLTDVENAILLHHQNTKEIEFQKLNENINKAADEDNKAAILEYKTTKARVLDELQQIYDINKAVGTENARGLASRRMMVDRKYSLVNMISEKRATANEGKPLSDQQQAQIEKLHEKIKETQDKFDNYIKDAESKIIDLQRTALAGSLKNKKTASQKLRQWADRIRQASKNQAFSSPIPITPHMIADAIDLIADGVEKGEQLAALIKKALSNASNTNPGISEQELEKSINDELINSGILDPSPARKKASDMSGLFANGMLDRDAVRLKVEADRAKSEYDISLKRDKESQLPALSKAQNLFVKWQRAFKLSNPLTMGKLMMAGFTRLTTTPLEDIVGGAYSAVLPQLAKGSIGEGGGLNVTETAKAYKNGLMLGLKDAREIMSKESHGKSELDVLFGKAGELPPEAIDFFGQLHSATKAPIKRAIFERSLERRLRRNIVNGVDVTDPMVQTSVLMDAYKDANRAIFMQDNTVAEGWRKLINHFDKVDPKTGKAPSKLIATTLQWMVPFVKVPTNIAAEIGTHIYGAPVGAYKLIHAAFTGGIENLPEDQKDIILRNLKKGSLGVAALALGYFNPQNFGGFYQPGQKRDEDDAEALGLKLFGVKVPSWFVEAPIYQAMQLGATVRRVKDKVVKGEEQGIGEGLWAGASGLVQDIPLASQPIRVGRIFTNPKERNYYFDELAKSTVDPALVTYLAKVTDPADKGNPIRKALAPENKRVTPKTLGEHIKSGVPFLREQLESKDEEDNTPVNTSARSY